MHNPHANQETFIPPAPVKVVAETVHFQVVYTQHETGAQMFREGVPTLDRKACEDTVTILMARHDVKEAFICTVHAAYTKETSVKQVI